MSRFGRDQAKLFFSINLIRLVLNVLRQFAKKLTVQNKKV